MESFKVQTFQHIMIEYRFADVSARVFARLIDWAIELSWFLLFLFIGIKLEADLNETVRSVATIVILLPVAFYTLFFELILNGQTPGKRIMKIRVMRLDGKSCKVGNYLLRWMFFLVDWTALIGLILIAASNKHQRIGDLVAGTTVVSLSGHPETMEPLQTLFPADYKPIFTNVSVLSDQDIQVLRQVIFTARRNNAPSHALLQSASAKVRLLLGLDGSRYEGQEFLETVVMDHAFMAVNSL